MQFLEKILEKYLQDPMEGFRSISIFNGFFYNKYGVDKNNISYEYTVSRFSTSSSQEQFLNETIEDFLK